MCKSGAVLSWATGKTASQFVVKTGGIFSGSSYLTVPWIGSYLVNQELWSVKSFCFLAPAVFSCSSSVVWQAHLHWWLKIESQAVSWSETWAQVSSCLASCPRYLLTTLASWAWTSLKQDLSEPVSKSLSLLVLLWAGMMNTVQLYSKVTLPFCLWGVTFQLMMPQNHTYSLLGLSFQSSSLGILQWFGTYWKQAGKQKHHTEQKSTSQSIFWWSQLLEQLQQGQQSSQKYRRGNMMGDLWIYQKICKICA